VPTIDELPGVLVPESLGAVIGVTELLHNAGNAATGGVWRVDGTAGSAVLKIARSPLAGQPVGSPSWQTSTDPAHWNYWKREVEAYRGGITRAYAEAGIVAPEPLRIADRDDGGVEVWLPFLTGTPGMQWPVPRLAEFAYRLGLAQARWAGRVPDLPWLSRGWLAQYVAHGPAARQSPDLAIWCDPLAEAWPAADRATLADLWAHRDRVVAAAEAGPRTLCHLDVWPNNLIDGDAGMMLLDWAFVGSGGIGEDVANLIVDSVADGWIATSLLPEITSSCTERYVDGLRDGGWTGSPAAVRTAIAIAGAAKYCWLSPAALTAAVRASYRSSGYGRDRDPAAAMARLSTVAGLLAHWARLAGI
jgi:hypothetical protein